MTRQRSSVNKVLQYAATTLRLESFFDSPGDQRKRPQISAKDLVRVQIIGHLLRVHSFHGIERLLRTNGARKIGCFREFREDSLAYFNERLDV